MLLRRGSITREMANAADEFRKAGSGSPVSTRFAAADLSRVPGARSRGDGTGPTRARQRVQDALAALGGIGRVPGSCAWHILGLE